MESEKLIERLQNHDGVWCSIPTGAKLIADAATALEQLQAENDRLKRERDEAVKDLNAIIGDIEEIRRRKYCRGRNEHGTVYQKG